MKDLMLDIEAIGTQHDAAIVQVGACYFNRNTGKVGKKFYMNIDLQSCLDKELSMTGDTFYWWMSQADAARDSITKKPRGKIKPVLSKFSLFAKDAKYIWCHTTYDFSILNNALHVCGLKLMDYFDVKDIRTLTHLADVDLRDFKREGVHHSALDDCIFQVEYVTHALNKIKSGLKSK